MLTAELEESISRVNTIIALKQEDIITKEEAREALKNIDNFRDIIKDGNEAETNSKL